MISAYAESYNMIKGEAMRIAVISDTHGSLSSVDRCILRAGDVEGWLHLGDVRYDARYLAEKTGRPVYSVYGNCDGGCGLACPEEVFPIPQTAPASERVVTINGVRVFICHGHNYDVDLAPFTLSYRARELDCGAALYGHTHIASLEAYGGLLLLNPGSPSRPRAGRKPSFAILTVLEGKVNADIILL